MTYPEFFDTLESFYTQGMALIHSKNADYAGEADPWANFRSANIVGVSPERAILVRMLDKMCRISNLLDSPAQVKDESVTDTLLDVANYANLLHALLKSK